MFDYPHLYTCGGNGAGDIYRENFPALDRCSEGEFCDDFVEDPYYERFPRQDRPSEVEPCLACTKRNK